VYMSTLSSELPQAITASCPTGPTSPPLSVVLPRNPAVAPRPGKMATPASGSIRGVAVPWAAPQRRLGLGLSLGAAVTDLCVQRRGRARLSAKASSLVGPGPSPDFRSMASRSRTSYERIERRSRPG
jgi:hypothetical protein